MFESCCVTTPRAPRKHTPIYLVEELLHALDEKACSTRSATLSTALSEHLATPWVGTWSQKMRQSA